MTNLLHVLRQRRLVEGRLLRALQQGPSPSYHPAPRWALHCRSLGLRSSLQSKLWEVLAKWNCLCSLTCIYAVKQAPATEVSMERAYCQLYPSQFGSLKVVSLQPLEILLEIGRTSWERKGDQEQGDNDQCPWTHAPGIPMLLLLTPLSSQEAPLMFISSLPDSHELPSYSASSQVYFYLLKVKT